MTMANIPELQSTRTIADLERGFLPEWRAPITSIGGDMTKMIAEMILFASDKPVSLQHISARVSKIQEPGEPIAVFNICDAHRKHLRYRVANEGLATVHGSTKAKLGRPAQEYNPTDTGRRALGLLGAIATWQISNRHIPLQVVLSERISRGPYDAHESAYASFPMANLRILQILATHSHTMTVSATRFIPERPKANNYENIKYLENHGLVERPDRRIFKLADDMRPAITQLLLGICSLQDPAYHEAATTAATDILKDPALVHSILQPWDSEEQRLMT
jgi:hypothetical protein